GVSKLESAAARIHDLNPNVRVETFETRLTSENALDIIREFDIVADGTDNFPTRYLVNDACVLLDKPNVYGSIFRFEGQASVFHALKLQFRELKLEKDPECPVCGAHPTVTELIDYQAFCGIGAEPSYDGAEITAHELRDEWQRNPALVVVDVREPHEYEIAHIDGAVLMPLGELPDRLGELDGHHEIVTHCHHGARSLKALEILKAAGFSKVRSLRGGIDAWAVNVDPA